MMRWCASLLALGSAGCTADVPAPELTARTLGAELRCIDAAQIVARRAVGPRSLVFEMADGTVYRNQLPAACPSLSNARAYDVISLELQGNQICSGDTFRAFDPAEPRAGGLQSIPECRLGAFTPIEPRSRR
ncbi:MAG: hypothetical protein M3N07_03370 [Pseudomonadota bacterium]|nr:hypothetical protein [Pseudomonadota bacterium]